MSDETTPARLTPEEQRDADVFDKLYDAYRQAYPREMQGVLLQSAAANLAAKARKEGYDAGEADRQTQCTLDGLALAHAVVEATAHGLEAAEGFNLAAAALRRRWESEAWNDESVEQVAQRLGTFCLGKDGWTKVGQNRPWWREMALAALGATELDEPDVPPDAVAPRCPECGWARHTGLPELARIALVEILERQRNGQRDLYQGDAAGAAYGAVNAAIKDVEAFWDESNQPGVAESVKQ